MILSVCISSMVTEVKMKAIYREFLEKLENRRYAEAIELTFSKAIPDFVSQCENEYASANMLISFEELIRSKKERTFQDVSKKNGFYYVYEEFCNHLFAMIDSCSNEVQMQTYEILEMYLNDTVTDLIIEGLNNGTISLNDLE